MRSDAGLLRRGFNPRSEIIIAVVAVPFVDREYGAKRVVRTSTKIVGYFVERHRAYVTGRLPAGGLDFLEPHLIIVYGESHGIKRIRTCRSGGAVQ